MNSDESSDSRSARIFIIWPPAPKLLASCTGPPRWSLSLVSALVGRALATTPGVSPASVSRSQNPGTSFNIQKTINTPEIPPTPDIVLLVDKTGSMGGAIADIRTNLKNVISSITSSQPTAEFAVVEFGDDRGASSVQFWVDIGLSSDVTALQNAVNGLTAGGFGDTPEDWINALYQIASGDISFRSGSSRVVVRVGDAPSHDPSGGHTLNDAISALKAANIRVIAVDVGYNYPPSPGKGAIDTNGQASSVTSATGGSLLPVGSGASGVTDAITNGLYDFPPHELYSAEWHCRHLHRDGERGQQCSERRHDKLLRWLLSERCAGAKFGPYPTSTNIKLVQAPGATPKAVPGEGAVTWQIRVKGCAQLITTDDAGNNATPINCCARP
ncbi:hypothetical protein PENSUB_4485 [Penicillium subrubescens]|uniref:VWFA domain-containing protein n=1 Tax=Penicillium subrubescens TaxID=1316194 RepID=A0A1Q5UCE6_9EURO|nr:hypothetical protein PENSUB_4485 [Penicillium subrubescens]